MRKDPKPQLDLDTLRSMASELVDYPLSPDQAEKLLATLNPLLAEVAHVTLETRGGAEPEGRFRLGEWDR